VRAGRCGGECAPCSGASRQSTPGVTPPVAQRVRRSTRTRTRPACPAPARVWRRWRG
jgi:hypothetical protein